MNWLERSILRKALCAVVTRSRLPCRERCVRKPSSHLIRF
jgi:hypothetical protein